MAADLDPPARTYDFADPEFAQAVLELAPLIVLVLDRAGRILHYNGFMERLCGCPLAQMRGRDWFEEFVLAEERSALRGLFAQFFAGAPVRGRVNFIRVHAGELCLIEWSAHKLRNADSVVAIGVDITDRVREANERAELSSRFSLFANRVDEAFFMTNATRDRILYLSPAWERLLGIPRELAYADAGKIGELVHPDDRQEFARAFGERLEAGAQIEQEYRMLRPIPGEPGEHELYWLAVRQSAVVVHEGEEPRVVGTVTDITERKRAQAQAEELGRVFALFDEAVPEVFFLLSPNRDRMLFVSESVERLLGLDREAVIRDPSLMLQPVLPEDREAVFGCIDRAVVPESGASYEFRVRNREGQIRCILARVRALGPESPMPGALAVVAMDITARYETEAALRRATEELEARVAERTRSLERSIAEHRATERRLRESLAELEHNEARLAAAQRIAEVGDWDCDIAKGTLHWSEQVCRIFGREPAPPTHAEFFAAVHPDDRALVEAELRRAVEIDAPYELEHRIIRPDGEQRTVLAQGEVTRDARGRAIRMQGTIQDVTRRTQVEAQLRASLAEKEALLHEIHHRVKNNLQIVASLLYLQGTASSSSDRGVLDDCRTRIRSMALIHEQLYLSGELSGIEMREFLEALGRELKQVFADDRRIEIRVGGGGLRLAIERAVPVALIVHELLTNALKYAYPELEPGAYAEVRVELGPDAIEIADDGVGLPAGHEPATSTSLGLRLVYTLARQLDAQLEFVEGRGTRVRLRISGD